MQTSQTGSDLSRKTETRSCQNNDQSDWPDGNNASDWSTTKYTARGIVMPRAKSRMWNFHFLWMESNVCVSFRLFSEPGFTTVMLTAR